MAFAGIFVLSCGNLSCLKNTPLRKLLPIFERPQRREIRLTTKSRLEYPKYTTATFYYNTKLREIKGIEEQYSSKIVYNLQRSKAKNLRREVQISLQSTISAKESHSGSRMDSDVRDRRLQVSGCFHFLRCNH